MPAQGPSDHFTLEGRRISGLSREAAQSLARSLYDAVAVDQTIPPEFYRAVAEIVHMIQEKRSSWSSTRRRIN